MAVVAVDTGAVAVVDTGAVATAAAAMALRLTDADTPVYGLEAFGSASSRPVPRMWTLWGWDRIAREIKAPDYPVHGDARLTRDEARRIATPPVQRALIAAISPRDLCRRRRLQPDPWRDRRVVQSRRFTPACRPGGCCAGGPR
jgi:hypothetical protein